VALVQCDDVISLLAALGAAVDMPINPSHQPSVSLIQWTSMVLEKLLKRTRRAQSRLAGSKPIKELPTSPAGDTWAQYRAYLAAVLPKKELVRPVTTQKAPSSRHGPVPPGRPYENHTSATTDYYARAVRGVLDWGQRIDPGALPPQAPLRGQGADTHFRTDCPRDGAQRYALVNASLRLSADWLTLL
jgi:hypothetical protein